MENETVEKWGPLCLRLHYMQVKGSGSLSTAPQRKGAPVGPGRQMRIKSGVKRHTETGRGLQEDVD